MAKRICPVCGREESDPHAQFCDIDGEKLVDKPEPTGPPSAPASTPARSHPEPPPRRRPWGLILGLAGIVLIGAAALIFFTKRGSIDLGKTRSTISFGDKDTHPKRTGDKGDDKGNSSDDDVDNGEDKEEGEGQRTGQSPIDGLLHKCYGGIPPIPKVNKGATGSLFEVIKNVVRTGTKTVVDMVSEKLTPQREVKIGERTSRYFLRRFGRDGNRRNMGRVNRLVSRLARQATRQAELGYKFAISRLNRVNAFMFPGGRGIIFRGLLRAMSSDAQLAFIIAHEIAHAELKHSINQVRMALAGRKLGRLFGAKGSVILGRISGFMSRILRSTYDQDREYEADRLGLCLIHLAGFSPSGSHRSLKAISRGGRSRRGRRGKGKILYHILSTHPPMQQRIAYLKRLMKKLK